MPADRLVILTRTVEDNAPLVGALSAHGVSVVEVPCLASRPRPFKVSQVGGRGLAGFAAVAFTSRRAVAAVAHEAKAWRAYGGLLAAVGSGTAEAMTEAFGRPPEVISEDGTGGSLAEQLANRLPVGGTILHLRGDKTTGTLQGGLTAAGFSFHEEVVYENVAPVIERLDGVGAGTLALFASPSAARRFFAVNEHLLDVVQPVAIGPTTQAALLSLGTKEPAVATRPDMAALLECIIELTRR